MAYRLPRGDRRVDRAPSGGRGPYPYLTTRGVAGPSLHAAPARAARRGAGARGGGGGGGGHARRPAAAAYPVSYKRL
jgi:hypothetical protein